jgi:hypothetical protein
MMMMIIIIRIIVLKVIMTLSPELEVITKSIKKSRFTIDDAVAENYLFKGMAWPDIVVRKVLSP